MQPSTASSAVRAAALLSLLLVTSPVLVDSCPEKDAVASFNSSAFLGQWYSLKKTVGHRDDENGSFTCLSTLVKHAGEHVGRLAVHTSFTDHRHEAVHVILGALFKEDNSSADGKFLYSRRMLDTESDKKFYILDTDYNNYAVTWYCFPSMEGQVTEMYSVLSRQRTLDPELTLTTDGLLPPGRYETVSHEHCPRPLSRTGEELATDSATVPSAEET